MSLITVGNHCSRDRDSIPTLWCQKRTRSFGWDDKWGFVTVTLALVKSQVFDCGPGSVIERKSVPLPTHINKCWETQTDNYVLPERTVCSKFPRDCPGWSDGPYETMHWEARVIRECPGTFFLKQQRVPCLAFNLTSQATETKDCGIT